MKKNPESDPQVLLKELKRLEQKIDMLTRYREEPQICADPIGHLVYKYPQETVYKWMTPSLERFYGGGESMTVQKAYNLYLTLDSNSIPVKDEDVLLAAIKRTLAIRVHRED